MIWRCVSLLPSGVWHKAAQDSGAGRTGTGCEGNNVLSYNYMENVGSWHGTAALGRLCCDHTRSGICRQFPERKLNARKGCINISDLIFGQKKKKKPWMTLGCRVISVWQWWDSGFCHLWDEQTLCNTHLSTPSHGTHLMKALQIHINFHVRRVLWRKRSLLPDWFQWFLALGNSQTYQLKGKGGEKQETKEALVPKHGLQMKYYLVSLLKIW